jgi:hypothetical protein
VFAHVAAAIADETPISGFGNHPRADMVEPFKDVSNSPAAIKKKLLDFFVSSFGGFSTHKIIHQYRSG